MISLMFRPPTVPFVDAGRSRAGFARSQPSIGLNWFEELKERLRVL